MHHIILKIMMKINEVLWIVVNIYVKLALGLIVEIVESVWVLVNLL